MSDAREAFGRVSSLAAEHHADLDTATRVMAAQAWVGGGAPHFAASLATQRASLQSALQVALSSLAQAVVRQGGAAVSPPNVNTQVPVSAPTHGPFRGIDVRAMDTLITHLANASTRLGALGSRVRAELAGLGLPASPGWTIARAGEWAAMQVPDLRRRVARLASSEGWIPSDDAAFGLFAAFVAPGDPDALLAQLASGSPAALADLLASRDASLPSRVNAWWHRLSVDAQERLVQLAGFGSLNGLPATVRDRANRHLLAAEKSRLEAELTGLTFADITAELSALAPPGTLAASSRLSGLLRNIAMIERALAVGGTAGHPPALLLAFDLNGTGRLAVSWGDPDAADITVTYVPGLNTKLAGFAGDIDRARVLWQQSQATAGSRAVASVAWLGYDPPQLSGTFTQGASVIGDAPAERGGVELAAFTDGLRAAHQPSAESRTVILGHSYGSLVTGKAALLRPGRLADDLIFVGSPGVGVDHAKDLGIGAEHVWVGEDRNDPVAMLGRFTRDPGAPDFGAQHFPVGRHLLQEAHSMYWEMHSSSLRNMGRIVTQHYAELEAPETRVQPQLLMPEFLGPKK
ncbi:alpha/beta hydrolase [Nonomuraea sp. NPDC050556]|uniref:alpha/beta hydrolase n=1 Tax=Nonomuraea sp. NPDC050556 TaxID=3364369 RepID=UPI0037917FC8